MKKDSKNRWARMREMGKRKFVLIYGVLMWGLLTPICYNIYMFLAEDETLNSIALRAIISLIVFPVGGYFWGLWVWWIYEKKYAQIKDSGSKL